MYYYIETDNGGISVRWFFKMELYAEDLFAATKRYSCSFFSSELAKIPLKKAFIIQCKMFWKVCVKL